MSSKTRIKVAEQKAGAKVRGSNLRRSPGDIAYIINLTYVLREGQPYVSTTVISVGDDATLTIGEAVRWLNRELRTVRDAVTGKERELPDSERFPRVVTKAEDPRLPMIPSVALSRAEAAKYQATLVRFGAVHYQDVENLVPYYKHVVNLKRKAGGDFEIVTNNI